MGLFGLTEVLGLATKSVNVGMNGKTIKFFVKDGGNAMKPTRYLSRPIGTFQTKGKIPYSKVVLASLGALFLGLRLSQAAVNVYLGPNVPLSMQADFIANTTTQYQTTLVPSTYFPGTYTLTILGKNPPPQCGGVVVLPCNLDQDVTSMVAITTKSYDYGFANGMDTERQQDTDIIYGLQGQDFARNQCGGVPITVGASTTTIKNLCVGVYSAIVSTVSLRWLDVFTSTGGKVTGP